MESLLHGAFSESPSLTFIDPITPALHTLSTLVRVYFFMYVTICYLFMCILLVSSFEGRYLGGRNAVLYFF